MNLKARVNRLEGAVPANKPTLPSESHRSLTLEEFSRLPIPERIRILRSHDHQNVRTGQHVLQRPERYQVSET
jgi:hypothetical protein